MLHKIVNFFLINAEMKKILDHQLRDRAHVFEWMTRLAAAQAYF